MKGKAEEEAATTEQPGESAIEETVHAWRRILRPRVLLVTGLAILLVILLILGFKAYALVSEDLVLALSPTSAALELAHGDGANLSFTLTTNNYLLCEARCSYELRDLRTGESVLPERKLLLRNEQVSLDFSFTAPAKGEGPMTGRGMGRCKKGEEAPEEGTPFWQSGFGRGFGRRMGR